MASSTFVVLQVLCWALFQVAQARELEDNREVKASLGQSAFLNNPFLEISAGLYEGDIVLSQEQKLLLQQNRTTNPAVYWPKDSNGIATIRYRYGDTKINRGLVRDGLSQWSDRTCVLFEEVDQAVGYPHLNFVDADHCASYLGMISSMTTGQTVWLNPACLGKYSPGLHEIGHALGLIHEHTRTDRDDYVQVNWNNIQTGQEGNFDKKVTDNYGIPYDYFSLMHYGATYFTSIGQVTLSALNPMAQSMMGNRMVFTFWDIRMVNSLYGCPDTWLARCNLTSNPCKNMGYIVEQCYCTCPDNTYGAYCEIEFAESYIAALFIGGFYTSKIITTPGTVSTEGYPTPYNSPMTFVKVLVAPYCSKVKLTVVDFDLHSRYTDGTCAIASLIVRTQDALGTGVRYCGNEITPGTVFISGNNTIVLDYRNIDFDIVNLENTGRGFDATVEHILIDGCTETTTTITTPTATTSIGTTSTSTTSTATTSTATTPTPTTTTSSDTTLLSTTSTATTSTATTPTPTATTTTAPTPTTTTPATTKITTTKPTTTIPTTTIPTTPKPTTKKPKRPKRTTKPKKTTTKPTTTKPQITKTTKKPTTKKATTTKPPINMPAFPAVKIINIGDIPSSVSTSSSGLCILSNTSTSGSYKLTSPRYPLQYQAGDACSVNLRMSVPSYLIVTATSILTAPDEIIYLNSVFGQATSVTSEGTGQSYVLPSAATSLSFTPIAETLGKTFELRLQMQKSDCHQIIKVDAGIPGYLIKVNYAANTMCEWWIQAPTGREIQLAFSTFNVGESGCAGDFLGIDTSGDPLYKSASRKYCATSSPNTVTSSGGQMNVLLKGVQGGYPGFIATYSVV